jgi:hypothetical protein
MNLSFAMLVSMLLLAGKAETKYTENGPGKPGGQSWTVDWLKFDNSYFTDVKAQDDPDLLVLPTDAVLFQDDAFRSDSIHTKLLQLMP